MHVSGTRQKYTSIPLSLYNAPLIGFSVYDIVFCIVCPQIDVSLIYSINYIYRPQSREMMYLVASICLSVFALTAELYDPRP